jgi:DNA repair protein RadC
MTTENSTVSEIQVSYKPFIKNGLRIKSSNDAYQILKYLFSEETIQLKGQFVVLYLNTAGKVIGSYQLSTGGLTGTIADVRLILSVALKSPSTGIILAHNHPSGNLNPSEADKLITNKIQQAAKLMDIKVLDHIILSIDGFYSFTDECII